ncbi:hypothetical protein ACRRTK_018727 [Alexandromys fortis]
MQNCDDKVQLEVTSRTGQKLSPKNRPRVISSLTLHRRTEDEQMSEDECGCHAHQVNTRVNTMHMSLSNSTVSCPPDNLFPLNVGCRKKASLRFVLVIADHAQVPSSRAMKILPCLSCSQSRKQPIQRFGSRRGGNTLTCGLSTKTWCKGFHKPQTAECGEISERRSTQRPLNPTVVNLLAWQGWVSREYFRRSNRSCQSLMVYEDMIMCFSGEEWKHLNGTQTLNEAAKGAQLSGAVNVGKPSTTKMYWLCTREITLEEGLTREASVGKPSCRLPSFATRMFKDPLYECDAFCSEDPEDKSNLSTPCPTTGEEQTRNFCVTKPSSVTAVEPPVRRRGPHSSQSLFLRAELKAEQSTNRLTLTRLMELAMTSASATLCQGLCSILSAVGRKGEGHGKAAVSEEAAPMRIFLDPTYRGKTHCLPTACQPKASDCKSSWTMRSWQDPRDKQARELPEHVTNEEGVKKLSVQNAGNETGGTWKYTQEVNSTDTIC